MRRLLLALWRRTKGPRLVAAERRAVEISERHKRIRSDVFNWARLRGLHPADVVALHDLFAGAGLAEVERERAEIAAHIPGNGAPPMPQLMEDEE